MVDKKKVTSRLITPVGRVSFPTLFKPESYLGGDPKYGLTLIFDPRKFTPGDKARWLLIKAALNAESLSRFKVKFGTASTKYKWGLRDSEDKEGLKGYDPGTVFASMSTRTRPGVVDIERNPIGPEHDNAEEIYPGCYCRATVRVYSYDNKGKGVSLGVANIQKIKDGERLDGRVAACDDFEGEDIDDAWLEGGDDSFLD